MPGKAGSLASRPERERERLQLKVDKSVSFQLYKQTVYNTVAEFIPLTMTAIVLQPSAQAKQAPSFDKEVYVDFVAVQIKFLSFLAYIIRIFQDQVGPGVWFKLHDKSRDW